VLAYSEEGSILMLTDEASASPMAAVILAVVAKLAFLLLLARLN